MDNSNSVVSAWNIVGAIATILAAFATAGATLVALYLARRASAEELKVELPNTVVTLSSDITKYFEVTIVNVSSRTSIIDRLVYKSGHDEEFSAGALKKKENGLMDFFTSEELLPGQMLTYYLSLKESKIKKNTRSLKLGVHTSFGYSKWRCLSEEFVKKYGCD